MNYKELIRQKFAAIRKQSGLSQARLGDKLHCDQATISKKESGKIPIYAWELAEFSEITGVEVKAFFE